MVRSRRWLSKEDGASVHTDSGVSLSSPPAGRAELGDGAEAQDLHATPKKKQIRCPVSIAKATKRARKSKDVSSEATSVSKKQKTSYSADLPVCESISAPSVDQVRAVEVQLVHTEANSAHVIESSATAVVEIGDSVESANKNAGRSTLNEAPEAADSTNIPNLAADAVDATFIIIPAAGATVDSINTVDAVEKSVIVLTTILENSISVVDSAFSETDVTHSHSAADLSDLTHSANNSTNSIGDSASTSEATLTPAANKRSGKVFMRKVHACHICSKQFRGNNDLRRHMLIHSDERPHKCEQCGNCYRQAVNLRNHINCAHTNQRQFACTQCPKMFAVKERLRLHMRLHSGEKPYACPECDKRFARGGHVSAKSSLEYFLTIMI